MTEFNIIFFAWTIGIKCLALSQYSSTHVSTFQCSSLNLYLHIYGASPIFLFLILAQTYPGFFLVLGISNLLLLRILASGTGLSQ